MKKIEVTVVHQEGKCIQNLKKWDKCIISEKGVEGDICIHALYSLLPKAFAMLYGADFPWIEEKGIAYHACPDPINPVHFRLKVVKE